MEYLQDGHLFINCHPDEATLETEIGIIGDRCVIFGSDYPHWDCGFPGATARMLRRNIERESVRRIFWDNAAALHTRLGAAEIQQHQPIESGGAA
jgi:predicted TIM-barrel fold metal-dependent hydrolase